MMKKFLATGKRPVDSQKIMKKYVVFLPDRSSPLRLLKSCGELVLRGKNDRIFVSSFTRSWIIEVGPPLPNE